MDDQIPMTPQGHARLVEQLEELKGRRTGISKAIAEARDKGDLRENAEYHLAREEQGLNEAKIRDLEGKLARAYIVRPSSTGAAGLGSVVKVLDLKYDEEEEYTLVGAGEEDYLSNRILTTSPMGAALVGAKPGDTVEFEAPGGLLTFKVLSVE